MADRGASSIDLEMVEHFEAPGGDDAPRGAASLSGGETSMQLSQYRAAAERAWLALPPRTGVKLPWDGEPFKSIFGDHILQHDFSLAPYSDPVSIESTSSSSHAVAGPLKRLREQMPVFACAVQSRPDIDHESQMIGLRDRAISKWEAVFALMSYPGPVGEMIKNNRSSARDRRQVLLDVFGIKSPHTLIKRANAMLRYLTFAGRRGACNVLDSETVLDYLHDREDHRVSGSTGSALLEAFRFCLHILGIEGCRITLLDPRLKGRCDVLKATRIESKQARPLTVKEVLCLEGGLMDRSADTRDRYLIGSCLFCVFARCRWSDIQHVRDLYLDTIEDGSEGFLETRSKFIKTNITAAKKTRFMPLVAPVRGVGPLPWCPVWVEIMAELEGLPGDGGSLSRVPRQGGGLEKRGLSSSEASEFLNSWLGLEGDCRVSSHSLKATTLSWLAKYGADEPERALLGHHVFGGQSLAVYSRDMLSKPLRTYVSMLQDIRDLIFRPDSTRSGWMTRGVVRVDSRAQVIKVESDEEPIQAHAEVSGTESSSSSSSASSSDLDGVEEHLVSPTVGPGVEKFESGPCWQHASSKMLHRAGRDASRLKCGRRVVAMHTWLEGGATFKWPRCSRCFAGEVLSNEDAVCQALDAALSRRQRRPRSPLHDVDE